MLRQLFRSEAHDALEAVTARVLATGSAKPSGESLTEMMRVTHTLKGAAGTVGLSAMVDLSHRLESAFAALGRDGSCGRGGLVGRAHARRPSSRWCQPSSSGTTRSTAQAAAAIHSR